MKKNSEKMKRRRLNKARKPKSKWESLGPSVQNYLWSFVDFCHLQTLKRTCLAWKDAIPKHARSTVAFTERQIQTLGSDYLQSATWKTICNSLRVLSIMDCQVGHHLDNLLSTLPAHVSVDLDVRQNEDDYQIPWLDKCPGQVRGFCVRDTFAYFGGARPSNDLTNKIRSILPQLTNLKSLDCYMQWSDAETMLASLPIGLERLGCVCGLNDKVMIQLWNDRPTLRFLNTLRFRLDLGKNEAYFAGHFSVIRGALARFSCLDSLGLASSAVPTQLNDLAILLADFKPRRLELEGRHSHLDGSYLHNELEDLELSGEWTVRGPLPRSLRNICLLSFFDIYELNADQFASECKTLPNLQTVTLIMYIAIGKSVRIFINVPTKQIRSENFDGDSQTDLPLPQWDRTWMPFARQFIDSLA